MTEKSPAFYEALISLQQDIPKIKKNQKVQTRAYSFEYADFESIMTAVNPCLAKHGFSIVHQVRREDNHNFLMTTLLYKDGQGLSSSLALPPQGDPQKLGGIITFFKRYLVSGLLNLTSDSEQDIDRLYDTSGNAVTKVNKKLSEDQIAEIINKAAELGESHRIENFLKVKKFKSLSEVNSEYFEIIMNWLEQKND